MIDGHPLHSLLGRRALQEAMFVLGVSLVGCPKPLPKVPIPGSDATPPTLVWEIYNLQTKERREIAQDGQTLDVPSNEQVIVTIAVEDLQSGVKDVSLGGRVSMRANSAARPRRRPSNSSSRTPRAFLTMKTRCRCRLHCRTPWNSGRWGARKPSALRVGNCR